MDRLIDWLPGNIPDDDSISIVHGDYRLDNMILHPTRATRHRGARLGTLDDRAPAGRFHLSPHGLANARDRHRFDRSGWQAYRRTRDSRMRTRTSTSTARVPAAMAFRTEISIRHSISSGWRRSCRVSPGASGTARQRASMHRRLSKRCNHWQTWAGTTPPNTDEYMALNYDDLMSKVQTRPSVQLHRCRRNALRTEYRHGAETRSTGGSCPTSMSRASR